MRKVRRQHMDHIAENGHVGSFHNVLVQKPVSFQEAMKIPEAKAAVDDTQEVQSKTELFKK